MKLHIPDKYIAYCPYAPCGMPYDASSIDIDETNPESFRILCPDCKTVFCAKCKTVWVGNHNCIRMFDQLIGSSTSNETRQYIEQHCRQCPGCNSIVEKKQSPIQLEHERRTGLSGGTEDCHHMTCAVCKTDFCWTCLQEYNGTSYYHNECPISDCIISFNQNIPRIVRLPLGIRIIRMKIINPNGQHRLYFYSPEGREEKSILLFC